MEDVLIFCEDTEVIRLLASKINPKANLRCEHNPQALMAALDNHWDLVFFDVTLSGGVFTIPHPRRHNPLIQIVALAPREKVRCAVDAVRSGANEYLTYPIDGAEIELVLETVQKNIAKHLELTYLRDRFWKSDWLDVIHTNNLLMRGVFDSVRNVAPTIATVLLLGDTGTGKGLMARLIHRHSHRSEGPFVAVHCGAIPETLIESELFGHEKGAFTGADRRKIGKFEMSREGTIFLDEIGTVTPAAQVKLLQVLQDGTFDRVGGIEPLTTNARIIAATNADLAQMVARGVFRRDLYYRLNIFPIEMPALKDRLEDLPHLVNLFLANLNRKYGKSITRMQTGLIEVLQRYDWPGNLRELENVLERAYILETGETLNAERFPKSLVDASHTAQAGGDDASLPLAPARQHAVEIFERAYLARLLEKNAGRIDACAKEAGITTRQLHRLLTKYSMNKKNFRPVNR